MLGFVRLPAPIAVTIYAALACIVATWAYRIRVDGGIEIQDNKILFILFVQVPVPECVTFPSIVLAWLKGVYHALEEYTLVAIPVALAIVIVAERARPTAVAR